MWLTNASTAVLQVEQREGSVARLSSSESDAGVEAGFGSGFGAGVGGLWEGFSPLAKIQSSVSGRMERSR